MCIDILKSLIHAKVKTVATLLPDPEVEAKQGALAFDQLKAYPSSKAWLDIDKKVGR